MLSRESISEQPRDKIMSGESTNIKNKSEGDGADTISSSVDSKPQS